MRPARQNSCRPAWVLVSGCLALLVLAGCGQQGPVERSWGRMKGLEQIVGNMDDTTYSGGRTQDPRFNAADQPVSMPQFAGKFVWADYAAPWCKPCTWQTPVTKSVEESLGDEVVFLTVMTGQSEKYNDHATVDTAKAWARRFGLDPARVVAAELWFKTVPEHRFYSPDGHTLFVHVGALTADQIRDVIGYYREGYETWKTGGTAADWMTFR